MTKLHLFRDKQRALHAFFAFKDRAIQKGQELIANYDPALTIIIMPSCDSPAEFHYFKSLELLYNREILKGFHPDEADLDDVEILLNEISAELILLTPPRGHRPL